MTNTKKIIKQIEEDSKELALKHNELVALETELNSNPSYAKFIKLRDSFNTQDALFKETVKNEMKRLKEEFGIKTIEGEFGKMTYVEPKPKIVVVDEDKIPNELKVLVPDLKAISSDYELTEVLAPGVELKESSPYVKITPKKEKK